MNRYEYLLDVSVEIRGLKDSDKAGIYALAASVYDSDPESIWFKSRPTEEDFGRVFEYKLSGMLGDFVIDTVACEGGKIVGECEIVKTGADTAVLGIIVDRKHRNKGVGKALLEDSFNKAREKGIGSVLVDIAEKNKNAEGFFGHAGFGALDPKHNAQKNEGMTAMQKKL